MQSPRLLAISLAAGLCALVCGCGDKESSKLPKIGRASLIDCGGKWLMIPPPPKMIRSDGIHPVWDKMLAASLPSNVQLLGYYSTFEDRVRIARQAPPASDRDCVLHIREKDVTRNVTSWGLGSLKDEIDDGIDQVTKDVGVQLANVIGAGSGSEDESEPTVPATVGKTSLLGWFGETDHAFGYSVAVDVQNGASTQAGTIAMVTSTVVALINGRILSFQATTSEAGESGQAWAEETTKTWSQLAMSANREYKSPSWIWRGIKLLLLTGLIVVIVRGVRYLIQLKHQVDEDLREDEKRTANASDD